MLSTMTKLPLLLTVLLLLSACSQNNTANSHEEKSGTTPMPALVLTEQQAATYQRSCAICHESSGTGAPMAQDQQAWADRIDQGMDVLMEHTINGTGGMPPMGMCMDCSQEDFKIFIQYMTGLECEE